MMIAYRTGMVLGDKTKGSIQNRVACLKDHIKNDFSTGAVVGAAVIGSGATIAKAPKFATKVANLVGKSIKFIAEKVKLDKVASKIAENPTKYGKIGLAVAGALFVLNRIQHHAFKAGQIDQKYTDRATLERQSREVFAELKENKNCVA